MPATRIEFGLFASLNLELKWLLDLLISPLKCGTPKPYSVKPPSRATLNLLCPCASLPMERI